MRRRKEGEKRRGWKRAFCFQNSTHIPDLLTHLTPPAGCQGWRGQLNFPPPEGEEALEVWAMHATRNDQTARKARSESEGQREKAARELGTCVQ